MSTVMKNPLILNSANYIYSWFLGINNKNDNLIKNNKLLEAIESDENIIKKITKDKEERYRNIEDRLKVARESLNE